MWARNSLIELFQWLVMEFLPKRAPKTFTGWAALILGFVISNIGIFYSLNHNEPSVLHGAVSVIKDHMRVELYGSIFTLVGGALFYMALVEDKPSPKLLNVFSGLLLVHTLLVGRWALAAPAGYLGAVYLLGLFGFVTLIARFSIEQDYGLPEDILNELDEIITQVGLASERMD